MLSVLAVVACAAYIGWGVLSDSDHGSSATTRTYYDPTENWGGQSQDEYFAGAQEAVNYGRQAGIRIVADGFNVTQLYYAQGAEGVRRQRDALCKIQLSSIPIDHPDWDEAYKMSAEAACWQAVMDYSP
jgi:hypothetical protein